MRQKPYLSMPKGFFMKLQTSVMRISCLIILSSFLASCVPDKTEPEAALPEAPPVEIQKVEQVKQVAKRVQLPVQYQRPSYMIDIANTESLDEVVNDVALKVGASIRSTQGPQPLWDILKRLASLKKMSVSWASDVDKDILVDVDIQANDDFYVAIDNLLRQVDYYHEMDASTIVVKYKETRQFHIAMPNIKSVYETAAGGNLLGGSASGGKDNNTADDLKGTISIVSKENEFNIWENIKLNLDTIMEKWSYRRTAEDTAKDAESVIKGSVGEAASRGFQTGQGTDSKSDTDPSVTESGNLQKSAGLGYYIVDQHLGLISVTAPRPILKKVDEYFTSLKKSIYKQIAIEAKIVEVRLTDNSSIGIDWNLLFKSLAFTQGGFAFGKNRSENTTNNSSNESSDRTTTTTTRSSTNNSSRWDGSSDPARPWTDFSGDYPDPSETVSGSLNDSLSTVATNAVNTVVGGAATSAATVITNGLASGMSGALSLIQAFSFDEFINAVKEQGQTTILSNPKLSVLNGQPALITVGKNVTYIDNISVDVQNNSNNTTRIYTAETSRVLSGVGMSLVATILDDNEIVMTLVPVTSDLQEPIEYRPVGEGEVGLPIINVREMSTTVKIKSGDMLVIGGLIGSYEANEGTFVPGLGSIPVVKYLFGYEKKILEKRELIILLKPRII